MAERSAQVVVGVTGRHPFLGAAAVPELSQAADDDVAAA